MSEKKRLLVFIIGVIVLLSVTALAIWSGLQKDDEQEFDPAPAPVEVPLEEEELPPENPDDIGVNEEGEEDFLTGGDTPGIMSDIDLAQGLPAQSDIYDAVKSAEAGIWSYENFGTETDTAEREELLKTMFAGDTPLDLTLPSEEERLEASYGLPMEFIVNIHSSNGMGGTEEDYRVELIGEKQTVITPTDGTLIPSDELNGYDINESVSVRWEVSMKKVHVPELDEEVWVVHNFSDQEI